MAAGLEPLQFAGRGDPAELARLVGSEGQALVMLAVPDQLVPGLAAALAERLARPPNPAAFVHVSGGLPLAALAPLAASGHMVGSFHPLQSFTAETDPQAFQGILVAVDASHPALLERLIGLARLLGARPRRVADPDRPLYHAAAVLASNDLVALAAKAAQVLTGLGWGREEALDDLLPLMRGVLGNLGASGLPDALTGPVRRGDPGAIAAHMAALKGQAGNTGEVAAVQVYRILGLAALELALEAGLEPQIAARIRTALTG